MFSGITPSLQPIKLITGRLLWIYDYKSSEIWAEICRKGDFILSFFPNNSANADLLGSFFNC